MTTLLQNQINYYDASLNLPSAFDGINSEPIISDTLTLPCNQKLCMLRGYSIRLRFHSRNDAHHTSEKVKYNKSPKIIQHPNFKIQFLCMYKP